MRAFIVALAVLIAAISAAFLAAANTQSVCREMFDAADRERGDPGAGDIRALWEKREPVLRLTVRGATLGKVTEAINGLEAAEGESRELALLRLRDAVSELERSGGITFAGLI